MKARDIPMETFEPIDIIADEPEQKPFDNEGFDRDVKSLASSDDRVAALVELLGKYEQDGAGQFLLERGDDGRLKHGAELRVIADVLSGKGDEDSVGSYFYGDDWSRVKAEAESFRREMNAGLHVGTGVWNTSPGMFTASDGAVKEAMRYDLGPHRLTPANTLTHKPPSRAEDPTRSHFVPATGSTFTPRDRLAEIIHEVTGHGFNNVRLIGDGQPEDPLKQDNTRNMYYVANDAELMAELGNLRKFVYRSSRLSGKTVDIARGDNLTLVLDSLKKNKDTYGPLPYTTEQFVEQMNKLRTYDGDDRFLRSRRDEVFGKLTGDESGRYLKQVVRYSPNDKTREQGRRADSKGGDASGESKSSGVRQAAGGGATKISYEDLRKLADTSYKGDMKAAVYSLDPRVITATVDSFGGNIDRTNRPMYIHRGKDGKITGYSTTNSGDALDKGVKPEGRFQSVLVPFVRMGKDGPEYTEDYNVAQKWYDESGQHYGKFDMDFTTPEAKARSIDRFNAASWLVHREQQLRYQPEFDKLLRQQAAKAGDARGESKSSGVPSGHNAALDGYSGPRVVINPSTFRNEKDGLCVAFNEAFRILMEVNGFDPVAEPTEKQREFFSDTAYANDELQMRRTILARICTFDTSVTDPTDEQLQEAVEFLDTVLEIGAPQNQWEQRAVERIRTAISRALESGERVPASQAPAPEDPPR